MKVIKIAKKIVGIMLIAVAVINVTQVVVKAANTITIDGITGVWSTWSMYEEDECVSAQFGRKTTDTDTDIILQMESSNGRMRMRTVGAMSAIPGNAYTDCSGGRTVIILATPSVTPNEIYYLPSYVVQYGYDFAGVLATSVVDDLVEARGVFNVNN